MSESAKESGRYLGERRIKAVIPSTASRKIPYPLDRRAYRRRNVIERFFRRLKNWPIVGKTVPRTVL